MGRAARVSSSHSASLVRGNPRIADAAAGARLASGSDRRTRPDRRTDGIRQDARRVPLGRATDALQECRRVLERERHPVPWRDLVRVYRYLELKGDVHGGRFVGGFSGEQYALPEAIPLLRKLRRQDSRPPIDIAASDPLNLLGILTPDARVPVSSRQTVVIG